MIIIRQALLRDVAGIQTLLTQLGYPPKDDAFVVNKIKSYAAEGYHLLVCEAENETPGFISMHWFDIFHSEGKMGRITAVCVREQVRAQGIGHQLLAAAEKFLASKGCSKIEVTSNVTRTLTHEFYLKNGYTEDSRRFVKTLTAHWE